MDPVLAKFRPLDRRASAGSGNISSSSPRSCCCRSSSARSWPITTTDRTSFYGIEVDRFLPFNFLRDVHIQSPIVWIGLSWIGAALFLAPAISGGEAEGTGLPRRSAVLGDAVHRRRRARRQLSRHHGLHPRGLVLVRQSGPLLYPARPRLADRLLRRSGDLEPARVPRAVADARQAGGGDAPVLDRADPARAPALGVHRQYRACSTCSA